LTASCLLGATDTHGGGGGVHQSGWEADHSSPPIALGSRQKSCTSTWRHDLWSRIFPTHTVKIRDGVGLLIVSSGGLFVLAVLSLRLRNHTISWRRVKMQQIKKAIKVLWRSEIPQWNDRACVRH
jgi:hypothetical protein